MFETGSKVTIDTHYLEAVGSYNFIKSYYSQGYGEILYYDNTTKSCSVDVKGITNMFDYSYVYPIEEVQVSNLNIEDRFRLFLELMEKKR